MCPRSSRELTEEWRIGLTCDFFLQLSNHEFPRGGHFLLSSVQAVGWESLLREKKS